MRQIGYLTNQAALHGYLGQTFSLPPWCQEGQTEWVRTTYSHFFLVANESTGIRADFVSFIFVV
jgi:hypothetical protein